MGLIYQVAQGAAAADFDSTGVVLRVPTCESVKIVEYGFTSIATDPGATGVLALQFIDAAGNTVTLDVQNPDHFKVVKVGDEVRVTYTEAVAVSVEPAAKK